MDYILDQNGDVLIGSDGDFLLEEDPVEQLRQRVRVALLTQLGETTITDYAIGFDWLGILALPKDQVLGVLIPQLTMYINRVTGVNSVKSVQAEVTPDRVLRIKATINGTIEFSTEI
jgi:hypothetical protein